mmetsp:Transcript_24550/g.44541  ORF Transcript_24550/g.44541 Transcript_24550/m.44541 type:complete len:93 (+) Transcript_24550:96-374(+)
MPSDGPACGRMVSTPHGKGETFWSHAVARQMDRIRRTVAHMGKQHVGTSVGGTTYQRATSPTKEQANKTKWAAGTAAVSAPTWKRSRLMVPE